VDVIVLRHYRSGRPSGPRGFAGSVINGGEARPSIPTQALIRLILYREAERRIDGVSMLSSGLMNSRTIRSHPYFWQILGDQNLFCSPRGFTMKEDMKDYLREHQIPSTNP